MRQQNAPTVSIAPDEDAKPTADARQRGRERGDPPYVAPIPCTLSKTDLMRISA
jgi:hypothetical protein